MSCVISLYQGFEIEFDDILFIKNKISENNLNIVNEHKEYNSNIPDLVGEFNGIFDSELIVSVRNDHKQNKLIVGFFIGNEELNRYEDDHFSVNCEDLKSMELFLEEFNKQKHHFSTSFVPLKDKYKLYVCYQH